ANGPYLGSESPRTETAAHAFGARGVQLSADEIFVSDGGKSAAANIQELFAQDAVVTLMDPAYPVYADANVMAGRSGPADSTGRYPNLVFLAVPAQDHFRPAPPPRPLGPLLPPLPQHPT